MHSWEKIKIFKINNDDEQLLLTLSLPAYHCRRWNSWRIYASPAAKGLNFRNYSWAAVLKRIYTILKSFWYWSPGLSKGVRWNEVVNPEKLWKKLFANISRNFKSRSIGRLLYFFNCNYIKTLYTLFKDNRTSCVDCLRFSCWVHAKLFAIIKIQADKIMI